MGKRISELFAIATFIGVLLGSMTTVEAQVRKRQATQRPSGSYLPRATFPTYGGSSAAVPGYGSTPSPGVSPPAGAYGQTGGGTTSLPQYSGLNLNGAMSHARGMAEVYPPGEPSMNGALVRWDARRFPLKIWISEGKKLPDVPWDVIVNDRVPRVAGMLQNNPNALNDLPPAPGWSGHFNDLAASGFELWRDLEKEGVISFVFADDPRNADVLVFFTDRFQGADGPGGTSVHGQTYGQVFTTEQMAQKMNLRQPTVPVVMELKVDPNEQDFVANAAHEFGHALGIKAHSEYMDDLMYVNRNLARQPSASDKATLRWLYKQTPRLWYY
jgi:hypothetical protein